MTILINPVRYRFGSDTALGMLLGDEPAGFVFDFLSGEVLIRDNTRVPEPPPELVINGTFDTNTTGWTWGTGSGTGSIAWINGMLRMINVSSVSSYVWQAIPTVVGKVYRFSVSLVAASSTTAQGNVRVKIGTAIGVFDILANGTIFSSGSYIFTATTTTTYINLIHSTTNSTVDWDNVSVREIGNFTGAVDKLLGQAVAAYLTKFVFNGFGQYRASKMLTCDHNIASLDTSATSLSSVGVGGGKWIRKTLTTTGAYAYQPGQYVRITDAADITKWMLGRVVSYSAGSLVVDVYTASGSFSASDWKVIVATGQITDSSRTNLCLQSQAFATTPWVATGVTVSVDATTAPDGTTTADKMVSSNATAAMNLSMPFTAAATVPYAMSVFAKAGEARYLQLYGSNDALVGYVNFDLVTGTVTASNSWVGSIQKLQDGWYRCGAVQIGGFPAGTSSLHLALVSAADSARAATFTGNGTDGLYLWGGQIEAGPSLAAGVFVSSYIPTTTTSLLRNADYFVGPAANYPVSTVAAGTFLWTGFAQDYDTGAGSGIETNKAISFGASPDTANTNTQHFIAIIKADTSTSSNARAGSSFKDENGSTQVFEQTQNFSFPVTQSLPKTVGLTWDLNERVLASGAASAVTVVQTPPVAPTPYRFRTLHFGGAIFLHHTHAVYLPRKLTQVELERRCLGA